MSLISNKCHYALRAVLELASKEGDGPLKIGQIAERQNIPARFLESILRELKQEGITHSVRGKDGGYVLAKPAHQIAVGEVVRLFRSSLFANETNGEVKIGAQANHCVFEALSQEAEAALGEVFDSITFEELLQKQKSFVPNYTI